MCFYQLERKKTVSSINNLLNSCSKSICHCSFMSFCLFYQKENYLYLSFAEILAFFDKTHSSYIMIIVNASGLLNGGYTSTFPSFPRISVLENILYRSKGLTSVPKLLKILLSW